MGLYTGPSASALIGFVVPRFASVFVSWGERLPVKDSHLRLWDQNPASVLLDQQALSLVTSSYDLPVAYGDKDGAEIERNGERYCYFDDEFWIWRKGLYCWIALDDPPGFMTVVNDKIAVVDPDTGRHYCNCSLLVLPKSGCVCDGL